MKAPRSLLLLIDDETFSRESTAALLSRSLDLLCVASAEEALELLVLHPEVDAILSDVMMPGMGPVGLHARLPARLQRRMGLLTGGISDPSVQAAIDQLDLPCLLKPCGYRDLVNMVSVLLCTVDDGPADVPQDAAAIAI